MTLAPTASEKPSVVAYRSVPDQENTGWPPGVPYIVGNEACERFSYYGMNAILYVHLASLYVLAGQVEEIAKNSATSTTHLFKAGVYAFPMIGAILADRFAGKYRTILYLSLVYCAGHAVLSLWDTTLIGMYLGLGLIAIGSGGIKPCVSANVGDQFGKANWFRVRAVYQIFYFSINFGSFFSTLLIPQIRSAFGASVAFAIPGILMFIATFIFWLGRRKFVHVPPNPGGKLGVLDTLSSTLFFLSVGHFFFSSHWHWFVQVLLTIGFLALGLGCFSLRQNMQRDEGFLTITLYALRSLFLGSPKESAPPASTPATPATGTGSDSVPSVSSQHGTGDIPEEPRAPVDAHVMADAPASDAGMGESGSRENVQEEGSSLRGHWFWGSAVNQYGQEATEGPVAVFKIISVFFLVSVFWALFDQHSTSWIRQAQALDLSVLSPGQAQGLQNMMQGVGISWTWDGTVLPSQVPALNPLMVMLLIPVMNVVYHLVEGMGIRTTPLRRMTVGMFVTAASFVAVALIQAWIDQIGPGRVPVSWQIIPYLILTVGEVMVSITGLEFAYTQAPKRMKSTVMGFWLLTVTVGNVLVAFLAGFEDLALVNFFWVFASLMAGAGAIFGLRALLYVPRDYAQT